MMKILEKPLVVALILLVLSGYMYFFQLDKIALTDPDETFYALTAKEMLAKGEWLTPVMYGKPQFEKPILFYWLIEISYKIFGINEFAARFPCALFGFLGLIGIYLLGRLLFNNRTGIFSAIILATSLEYIILSIGCVTDMVLFAFMLFGILFFFYAQIRKKDYFYILSSAAFALATLTKGPIGLLLPAFIIALYLAATKDFSLLRKRMILVVSLIVFAVIAKPWYIIMYKIHAQDFVNVFFGFHNVTRFLTPEHRTGSQIYYNIPIIFGGFFPWSVFLPFGIWHFAKKAFFAKNGPRNIYLFVLLWLAVIFIFFTVSSTKLPTYIFPCFISLALIVGKLWDDFISQDKASVIGKGVKASYYFLVAGSILTLFGAYMFIRMDYPAIAADALKVGSLFIVVLIVSLAAFVSKRFIAALFLIAASVAVIIYPIDKLILPSIEADETSKSISQEFLKLSKPGEPVGSERDYRAGVAFYTGRIPVFIGYSSTLHELMGSGERAWCILKEKNLSDLNGPGVENPKKIYIMHRAGKKRLITNIPPEAS